VTDWRKPIEALARLEAYAKLIRATQGTKTYLDQNITPIYREYLKTVNDSLIKDQQVIGELESCLTSLSLQSASSNTIRNAPQPSDPRGTWFDRFKGTKDEVSEPVSPTESIDIEGAKLAVEYTLSQLGEVQSRMGVTKTDFETMCDKIVSSQEDLVAVYGRLKQTWGSIAEEFKLPKDLSLKQLIGIVVSHSRIASLADKREALLIELREQSGTHAKLEQLLMEWRALTGSQKTSDLSHPTIAMTEARDVLRFFKNKQERLKGMEESRIASAVSSRLATRLRSKNKTLRKTWTQVLQKVAGDQAARIAPNHPEWQHWFTNGHLIRSLATVYQASPQEEVNEDLIHDSGPNTPIQVYAMERAFPNNSMRLQFLKTLEENEPNCYQLFIINDDKASEMLSSLGIGSAREIEDPAEFNPTISHTDDQPIGSHLTTRGAVTSTPAHRPETPVRPSSVGPKKHNPEPVLSSKAQEAIAILTSRSRPL
jgi:hypothetical protein